MGHVGGKIFADSLIVDLIKRLPTTIVAPSSNSSAAKSSHALGESKLVVTEKISYQQSPHLVGSFLPEH